MIRRSRPLIVFTIITLVLIGAGALTIQPATASNQSSSPNYLTAGLSGTIAAHLLNSMPHHSTRAMTGVHFILHWVSNVEFAGLWAAQANGWWQKAGIAMTYKAWAPGVAPETDVPVYHGNAFGYQSSAALIIARSRGVPIRAVYTDTQKSVFALIVLKKSGIRTLADLRGKRVGYQADELYVPETMMSCGGLRDGQWKPVQIGFDTSQLTAGNVDAYLGFVINEPIAMGMQGIQTHVFPAANACYHFYDDVLFTTDSLIKSNPALVRRVVGVAARGWAWALTHPAATAQLTVRTYFPAAKGISAAKNLRQQTLETRAFGPYARDARGRISGLMTASYWRDSIDTLARYKEVQTRPSVTSLFTNSFNPNH